MGNEGVEELRKNPIIPVLDSHFNFSFTLFRNIGILPTMHPQEENGKDE